MVFFYRNLTSFSNACVQRIMDLLLECLFDENVEVREMAARTLAGVIRCSQRQSILPLKVCADHSRRSLPRSDTCQDRFVEQAKSISLPHRSDENYAGAIRTLHGAILGITSLIEAFPYAVEGRCPSCRFCS